MSSNHQQANENPQRRSSMQKNPATRRLNGVLSAVILVVFFIHGLFASTPLSLPRIVAWVGFAIIGAHVVTSIITSVAMLADRKRPASPKKKKHLVLKWISGIALGVVACTHVMGFLPFDRPFLTAIVLFITWHAWICSRSFLKDLGLSTHRKPLFRAVVCVVSFATIALLWF